MYVACRGLLLTNVPVGSLSDYVNGQPEVVKAGAEYRVRAKARGSHDFLSVPHQVRKLETEMAEAGKYKQRMQHAKRAQLYAERFETGSRKRINEREQRAVSAIFADLPDCRSVIDVPSGAGRFARTLCQNGRVVIASDVAFEILEHGRERAGKLKLPVLFVRADAGRLPLGDGAVDCVFCNRLLHHILPREERAAFLREFHRATRKYVVVSFFDYHSFGTMRRLLKALKGRQPKYAAQPTFEQFTEEVLTAGFKVRAVVRTGAAWVAQKYFVLEKAQRA